MDVVRNACEEALISEGFVPDPIVNEDEGMHGLLASIITS